MMTMNPIPNDELDQGDCDVLMRMDLFTFLDRCFEELNPGLTLSDAAHLHIMAAKLADCLMGRGPKRLIICLPPRSLKSITVSVAAVAWLLGLDPTRQIICASYGQDLADKHARDTRTIIMNSFYRRVFPGTRLSPQKLSVNDFETTRRGCRMATSVGGVLTGRGGDVLIVDDPLKPADALSEAQRSAVNDWFDNTLLSRLNSKKDGIIILVMQRLHQDDLVGHLLASAGDWDVLSFPAIAEVEERHEVRTVFGPSLYERKVGEVLDPGRESLETLLAIKQLIGSYNFASQYQQDPAPVGGAMVLQDWLQYYDSTAPLPRFSTILQSWDTANKSGELNDYSVCITLGVYDGKFYLLDVFREKLIYPDLKRKVIELAEKHKTRVVLIEDRASGTQLIQDLKGSGHYKIQPYSPPPQTDKKMRLYTQTPVFEAGKVLLPSTAPWLAQYVRELTTFPGAKFDDQVDATTQALDYLSTQDRAMETWRKLGQDGPSLHSYLFRAPPWWS
jgi:predicted phage terminase large subunit-like protein